MQFSEDFKETTAISHYWILWLSMMGEISDSFSSFGIKRKYLHSKQWGNGNDTLESRPAEAWRCCMATPAAQGEKLLPQVSSQQQTLASVKISLSSLKGLCRCTNLYYSLGKHRLHTMCGLQEDIRLAARTSLVTKDPTIHK